MPPPRMADAPTIRTLGDLRASGYTPRPVKDEIRANLIEKLQAGEDVFPGILGFDRTVIPQIQNAILGKHDFILLGLRGQAKSRLVRLLPSLLDEWVPEVEGSEIHDDPLAPVSRFARDTRRRQRRRHADRVAAPQRALRREAGDARHVHRRPHRRHRPHQGRHAPAHLRRRGGDPLRDHPAHAPRHLRHQRAAGPPAAHPGGPAQRDGRAGRPDPRLQRPPAAGPDDGVHGQPRGLHQPRLHHHAAQGPHRQPDPHALPARA